MKWTQKRDYCLNYAIIYVKCIRLLLILAYLIICRYTKTVVAAGPDMQKYNPEVKLTPNLQYVDPRIANLADKLRHVHQVSTYCHFVLEFHFVKNTYNISDGSIV